MATSGAVNQKAPNRDDRHWRYQPLGISLLQQINPSKGNLLSMEGNMIDALFNVAVFAALVLCIVGFSAWAHKRVLPVPVHPPLPV